MPAYKNEFGRPAHHDHEILRGKGKLGTLRVKARRASLEAEKATEVLFGQP